MYVTLSVSLLCPELSRKVLKRTATWVMFGKPRIVDASTTPEPETTRLTWTLEVSSKPLRNGILEVHWQATSTCKLLPAGWQVCVSCLRSKLEIFLAINLPNSICSVEVTKVSTHDQEAVIGICAEDLVAVCKQASVFSWVTLLCAGWQCRFCDTCLPTDVSCWQLCCLQMAGLSVEQKCTVLCGLLKVLQHNWPAAQLTCSSAAAPSGAHYLIVDPNIPLLQFLDCTKMRPMLKSFSQHERPTVADFIGRTQQQETPQCISIDDTKSLKISIKYTY